MDTEIEDSRAYKVVIHHGERYSICFADRENPPGWKDAGMTGTRNECLEYIDEGTDVRPLSLRKYLERCGKRIRADRASVTKG